MQRTLALLLLLLPLTAAAQDTVYVTDKLFLGLYAEPEGGGEALETLVSGTPLQALERTKYFTRVRTPKGTEGWVKSAYLVDDKPPRLLLNELQTQNEQLHSQLQRARAELQSEAQKARRAGSELQELQSAQAERGDRAQRLEAQNLALQQKLSAQGTRIPVTWLIVAASVCLLFGLWLGYAWIDYRIRRRHGGFRIY